MSIDMCDDSSPSSGRTRGIRISEMMFGLATHGSGAANKDQSIGEFFFNSISFKYGDMPAGRTMYVDGLQTNIIRELSVSDFLHIHQARTPVIRTEYVEVQEIGKVSYRSMHTLIKAGKNWLPIIARIIPGVSVPLLMGMNYKDPDTQRKLGKLITPKMFFLKTTRLPTPTLR